MPDLKTNPPSHHPEPWLPSFDLHEENGELVLHAGLEGFGCEGVEVSLDGGELIVLAEGESGQDAAVCFSRLPLPFAAQAWRAVSRRDHEDLEIRIPVPAGEERP
jgi:HSP20 family molecular chaperone IbpA